MAKDKKTINRLDIAKDWLPRYTGMPIDGFGDYILLTNFDYYVQQFAAKFNCEITGEGKPMQAATNSDAVSYTHLTLPTIYSV